jgi:hypothetical protein
MKATRLNTLGENYAVERINKRILENEKPYIPPPINIRKYSYRYKGVYIPKRNVSGIYVIYLIFSMLQQKIINNNRIPDNPYKTRYTPEFRESIRRIKRYSQQTRLLCKHKIETTEQLQKFINIKNRERYVLQKERERIYNKMKYVKTPEKLVELKSERDNISMEIKVIQSDLFLLGCVMKECDEIKRKIITQRELEIRRCELEKSKAPNNTEMRGKEK